MPPHWTARQHPVNHWVTQTWQRHTLWQRLRRGLAYFVVILLIVVLIQAALAVSVWPDFWLTRLSSDLNLIRLGFGVTLQLLSAIGAALMLTRLRADSASFDLLSLTPLARHDLTGGIFAATLRQLLPLLLIYLVVLALAVPTRLLDLRPRVNLTADLTTTLQATLILLPIEIILFLLRLLNTTTLGLLGALTFRQPARAIGAAAFALIFLNSICALYPPPTPDLALLLIYPLPDLLLVWLLLPILRDFRPLSTLIDSTRHESNL